MDDRTSENLAELFQRLYDADQAKSFIEDIEAGEQIYRKYPAPEPDQILLAKIKADIAERLKVRKAHLFRRRVYEAAAVAAAVIILAAISVRLLDDNGNQHTGLINASLIPTAIWESDDIAADDANLAVFTAEIEQIEDEVLALQFDDDTVEDDSSIAELELELIEINSDFWKG